MISVRQNKKVIIASIVILALALVVFAIINTDQANAPDSSQSKPSTSDKNAENNFDKNKYSIDDPNSVWVIVNKKRPLPDGFAPSDLEGDVRRESATRLKELLESAQANGHNLYKISGFRSQQNQAQTYNGYVSSDGQTNADTYSARPGHSEHQTGLAVDLGNGTCDLETCFGDTPAGKWLAANSHKFGFIVRYQNGKEDITGYQYEPWHLRYVGSELAAELYKSGQTMEEFFGLESAPSY